MNPVSEYIWEELSYAAQLLSQPNTDLWDDISSPGLPLLCQRDGNWAFLTVLGLQVMHQAEHLLSLLAAGISSLSGGVGSHHP